MENRTTTFQQTNAFAMQYGVLLGAFGLLTLAVFVLSFQFQSLGILTDLMFLGSPFLATYFTLRFRKTVMVPEFGFTFGRAFGFTFFMGIYATLWVALGVFVYLNFFDGGYLFDKIEEVISSPQFVAQLRQAGSWDMIIDQYGSLPKMVNVLRSISPADSKLL